MLLLQLSTALCMLSTAFALALPKAEPQVVEVTVVEETTEIELTTDVIIDETVEILTGGLTPICTNLNTLNNGCIRCMKPLPLFGPPFANTTVRCPGFRRYWRCL